MLITAGPTREAIDPVRYVSNHSSGKQGYAIAEAALKLGARVTLVSGPVNLSPPPGANAILVTTADEMLKAVEQALPADMAIFAAAVADWKVAKAASEKMKKPGDGSLPSLLLSENPDILKTIATSKNRPKLVVGFAAETEKVIEHAKAKLIRKNCDVIVANDVRAENNVFGGDANTVHLVSSNNVENWPKLTKAEVADRLMSKLVQLL